ncbi:MAG TPA: glycosyltransferase [Thermodesulfobacteriota bacterium]|nr:glycosyltransferase [Thermodesulfobacteriota bacterium]
MNRYEPVFTIVIPTFGRPKQLKECLDSMSELSYSGEGFEVIVVDDGSKTSLDEIVGAFRKKINVKLIRQDHAGPAAARNRGGNESAGRYLAFTDDDCKPAKDWLSILEAALESNPEILVAGRTINDLPENPYSTTSQLIADFLYSYYNSDNARFLTSNNMAVAKNQFLKVGGFDISFPLAAAEDREFCDRYLFHGYKTLYVPEAVVRHAHPLTLGTFWRQHFNYGKGAHRFHKIRSQRHQDPIMVEPVSFYVSLLLYPRKSTRRLSTALSLLIALSQLANASGYFLAKYRPTG